MGCQASKSLETQVLSKMQAYARPLSRSMSLPAMHHHHRRSKSSSDNNNSSSSYYHHVVVLTSSTYGHITMESPPTLPPQKQKQGPEKLKTRSFDADDQASDKLTVLKPFHHAAPHVSTKPAQRSDHRSLSMRKQQQPPPAVANPKLLSVSQVGAVGGGGGGGGQAAAESINMLELMDGLEEELGSNENYVVKPSVASSSSSSSTQLVHDVQTMMELAAEGKKKPALHGHPITEAAAAPKFITTSTGVAAAALRQEEEADNYTISASASSSSLRRLQKQQQEFAAAATVPPGNRNNNNNIVLAMAAEFDEELRKLSSNFCDLKAAAAAPARSPAEPRQASKAAAAAAANKPPRYPAKPKFSAKFAASNLQQKNGFSASAGDVMQRASSEDKYAAPATTPAKLEESSTCDHGSGHMDPTTWNHVDAALLESFEVELERFLNDEWYSNERRRSRRRKNGDHGEQEPSEQEQEEDLLAKEDHDSSSSSSVILNFAADNNNNNTVAAAAAAKRNKIISIP